MPILTDESVAGRGVRLEGLPDFNAGDPALKVTAFEGVDDGVRTDATLIASPSGGAVAAGEWLPVERYYTLTGRVMCAPEEKSGWRAALKAALPFHREASVVLLGNGRDDDKQIFVRQYDAPTFPTGEHPLFFSFPLVAPDPFKYALTPLSGSFGVFSGVDWFRTYDIATTPPSRTYATDGAAWFRTYGRDSDTGPYPLSMGLSSPGDATSRRVVAEVVGPQPSGWWLQRQDEGGVVRERVWVATAVADGQTLTLDTRARSATLNGSDVSHLMFGDLLTLPPGSSTFRLVAPSDAGGYATVSALPAYL